VQSLLTLSIAKLGEKHWSQGPLVGGEDLKGDKA